MEIKLLGRYQGYSARGGEGRGCELHQALATRWLRLLWSWAPGGSQLTGQEKALGWPRSLIGITVLETSTVTVVRGVGLL